MKIQIPIKLFMGATLTFFALFGCSNSGIDTDIDDLGDRGKALIGDGGSSDVAEGYDKPLLGCDGDPLPVPSVGGGDPLPVPSVGGGDPISYEKEQEKPIPTPETPNPTAPILNDLVKIWMGEQLASKSEDKREVVIVDLSDAGDPPVVKSMTALEILDLIQYERSIAIKFNN